MGEVVQTECRVCLTEGKPFFSVRSWPLVRCPSCGFVQVAREPSLAELDEIYSKNYFDPVKYKKNDSLEREIKRRLNLMERANIPKNAKVLEIGCATGFFLERIKSEYDVHATDYSKSDIEQLKTQFPELAMKLHSGRIEDLPYPEGFFDAILMWDVLEHIWDVKELSKKLKLWLKPGGVLLLSSPDISGPVPRMMKKRWAFMTPPEHLSFFSRRSLLELFKPLGFELMYYRSLGKWVNLGFLIYKIGRVFPGFGRLRLQERIPGFMSMIPLYVPTQDIFYSILRKRG